MDELFVVVESEEYVVDIVVSEVEKSNYFLYSSITYSFEK